MISLLQIMRSMGLTDTLVAVFLPGAISALSVLAHAQRLLRPGVRDLRGGDHRRRQHLAAPPTLELPRAGAGGVQESLTG